MSANRFIHCVVLAFLSAGSARALPPATIDAIETKHLASEIRDLMANTDMQEDNLLTYVYFGPFAWSQPEARITVSRDANPRMEYLELSVHSRFAALEMLEAGERDARKGIQKYARHWIKTDAARCPAAKRIADDIDALAVRRIGEDKEDRNREQPRTVRLDGGARHVFLFGTLRGSSYGMTVFAARHPLIDKVGEMKASLIACDAKGKP